MRYKTLVRNVPIVIMIMAGTTVLAATASDVITARQAHFKDIGKAFKAINEQLKSSTPDLAVIKENAPVITRLAHQQNKENWFPVGTQAGQGLQTAAKGAIWQNAADFKVKRSDFANASASYATVAAKGDLEAIKAVTLNVGKACKACHEAYRDQDKS